MNKQLVIEDFFKNSDYNGEYISLDSLYQIFKSYFKELANLRDLIDNLLDEISPITYETKFKHNLIYDRVSNKYNYYNSKLIIDNVEIYLDSNDNVVFSGYNVDNKLLEAISTCIKDNYNCIKYILTIYKKYYSLFNYDNNKLSNSLFTYYLNDNLFIDINSNGDVKLIYNYQDISNMDISKFMMVKLDDSRKVLINDLNNNCKKLVLSRC